MGRSHCHSWGTINNWINDIEVELWNMQKVIDFSDYGEDPTYWTNMIYTSNLLKKDQSTTNRIYIQKHTFNNIDSWIPFAKTYTGLFYQIGRQLARTEVSFPYNLYTTIIYENKETMNHNRDVYTLIDCLSDIGGLN